MTAAAVALVAVAKKAAFCLRRVRLARFRSRSRQCRRGCRYRPRPSRWCLLHWERLWGGEAGRTRSCPPTREVNLSAMAVRLAACRRRGVGEVRPRWGRRACRRSRSPPCRGVYPSQGGGSARTGRSPSRTRRANHGPVRSGGSGDRSGKVWTRSNRARRFEGAAPPTICTRTIGGGGDTSTPARTTRFVGRG